MDFPFFRNQSYIRVLHASPGAPAVDVYADNIKIASNLSYRNLTSYIRVRPGQYNVIVYPAGSRRNPVYRERIYVPPGSISTVAATGQVGENFDLLVIPDTNSRPRQDTTYLRVVHLSPNAPAVNARIDNRILARNISYQDITRYVPLDPGTYTLSIFNAQTNQRVVRNRNLVLQPGFYYTSYILGLVDGNVPLEVITVIDRIYELVV